MIVLPKTPLMNGASPKVETSNFIDDDIGMGTKTVFHELAVDDDIQVGHTPCVYMMVLPNHNAIGSGAGHVFSTVRNWPRMATRPATSTRTARSIRMTSRSCWKRSGNNREEEHPMRRITICGAVASGIFGPPVTGVASLNTFIFEISNAISPEQPSASITLWAAFNPDFPKWFAFGETRTEVLTEFDRGWFSDPVVILDPWGFSKPGEVSPDGDRVSGIYAMQIYLPFSIYPDESNPILLWSATWTTDDFTPRQVGLFTESESFALWSAEGGLHDQFGIDFAEGSGVIEVVPAPGAASALTGLGAWMSRRKRPKR